MVLEELSKRVTELEIRYTHQASQVDELNVELTAANRRIDQLEREVRCLREMLGGLGPELTESPDE
jgi:SlyX protein